MPKIKKPAKKAVKKVVSAKKSVKAATKKVAKPAKKVAAKKVVASKKAKAKPVAKKAGAIKKVAKKAVKKVAAKKVSAPPAKKAAAAAKKTVSTVKKVNPVVAKKTAKTKSSPSTKQKSAKNKEMCMTKIQNKTKMKPQLNPPPMAVEQPIVKEDTALDTTMDDMEVMHYAIDLEEHDDQYMNDEQREHFRKILIRWKHQLMSEVDSTMGHMQEDGLSFPDPIDRAAQEEGFNLELRTRDRERKLIKKIEAALDMIETGEYGYCDDGGANIGVGRLEARPTATKCIDCKTYSEIREKQSGGA